MDDREPTCLICDRPILPGEEATRVSHDWMHEACLPSARRSGQGRYERSAKRSSWGPAGAAVDS